MVSEAIPEAVAHLVIAAGLPLLLGVFFLEGLVVGKFLFPPAVFAVVIAIASPHPVTLVLVIGGCTLAMAAGQWVIYCSFNPDPPGRFGFQWTVPYLDSALSVVGDKPGSIADNVFDRYGGLAVFLAAFVPGVRAVIAVPAGIGSYPPVRFLLATITGNVLYFSVLSAAVYGVVSVFANG